ncbi:hypothetical protein J5N97_002613 [Dioscorea zingiberensis]|uniref:Sister chromatid cohesion 1 protein 3 n=1 Tax=Dioscorea zingiberensis TaxID=325984 RepID=A0A9D5HQJ9_9LILI|nr:hypothetical protein J5N97_002613 [Dioscorea zingiberensis]
MFYSHTFLAKKSPLGTIWIAAHLERRFKKPQIENIDIPSSAESIMFPEVPIALRLSGHLLLGLVRIYSWKVNYLYQDCNRMLSDVRSAMASVQVELPAGADRAPVESITLPNTFALDALELDESTYNIDGPDKHRTTYEEITLTDSTPLGGGQYEAFYLDEDFRMDPSPQPMTTNNDVITMEEDVLPSAEVGLDPTAAEVGLDPTATPVEHVMAPSNQDAGSIPSFSEAHAPQELPEIDVMRNAVDDSDSVVPLESPDGNIASGGLADSSIHSTRQRESLSSPIEHVSVPEAGLASSPTHAQAPTAGSPVDPDLTSGGVSLGQALPDIELQPAPAIKRRRANTKRKQQYFDEHIILSNGAMREQLDDTSKLTKKRRKLPGSNLDVWRFHKMRQKDHIFDEPLLSGMSNDLQAAFTKRLARLNAEPVPLEASRPPNAEAQSAVQEQEMQPDQPQSDRHVDMDIPDFTTPDVDRSLEQPRSEDVVGGNLSDLMPSPNRRDFAQFDSNVGSASHMTFGTETMPTFEAPASAETFALEPETPFAHSNEQWPVDDTVPEPPTMRSSAEMEELSFLESSNASSDHEPLNVENMPTRTRAVAQYLKSHSPTTQNSKDQSGTLSLNNILEGKTKKLCARMFFETTVLKSYDLIDVQQEEAYGDILISVKPALSTTEL